MIKKTVYLFFVSLCIIACLQATAQDITVASGTACKIAANEIFNAYVNLDYAVSVAASGDSIWRITL